MRAINFLIKPSSSLCNLRCKYCFYIDESINRGCASMGIMDKETALKLIRSAYKSIDKGGLISFAFQGGEPTVAGLEFYKYFVKKAKEEKPDDVQIAFSIQTNGILIDEEWAKFLHDENFLVGLSIDGYKELHNLHRVDINGNDTWNAVNKTINLLKKYDVDTNALCVVTKECAKNPKKVYENLKNLGFRYLQFIACLDPIGEKRGSMPWSLNPEDYGDFLCKLFDLWYEDWEKGNYHSVRLFDDYIHLLIGDNGASTCATCGRCSGYFVVEADGSVYPCDFFALDEWKVGKIGEQSLEEIKDSDIYKRFLSWGVEKPKECYTCKYRITCNGGCKNDWEDGHNYYCSSFKKLFTYAEKRMLYIARKEIEAIKRDLWR